MIADLVRLVRCLAGRLRLSHVSAAAVVSAGLCWGAAWAFSRDEFLRRFCAALVWTGVGILVVGFLLVGGVAIWRPEQLASENYQLQREALEVLKQKAALIKVPPATFLKVIGPILRPLAGRGRRH